MDVGEIGIALTADNSGLISVFNETVDRAKQSMSGVAETAKQAGNVISNAFGESFDKARQTTYSSLSEMSAATGKTVNQLKSEAMKTAAVYRKQGLSQSDAIKKAYSEMGLKAKETESNIRSESNRTKEQITDNGKSVVNSIKSHTASVSSEANTASNRISSAFGKIGKAVAAAFSIKAVTSFVKAVTKSAAEVQAANAQFQQTFGSLSDNANEAMKKVADESGIVQTRLQGVGTSIYAFAKTSGMDSASALNMMQEALQVTADSAAYYDRSLEDVSESLKSFLKGNYANDAALGLSCTETTRNAAANRLYGKSFRDLSEAQKQLTLLQMVKDANAASGALGQAARESDGLENVLGNLKETWNQFLAVVGKPVLKVAVVVIQNITNALSRLVEVAKTAVGELGNLFGWEMDDAQQSAQATADAIALSVDNQDELTEAAKKTNKETERGVASFDRLNIISSSKADEADEGSSDASATPIAAMTQNAEAAAESVSNTFSDKFKNLFEKSGFNTFFTKIQSGIKQVNWSAIGENCKSIFKDAVPIAQTYFAQIQETGTAAMSAIGSAVGSMISVTGKSVQTVTGGIAKWLNRDRAKIQGFIKTIGTNFTDGFNSLSSFFDGWGEVVGGSIDRMRPTVENAIADLLGGVTDLAGGIGTVLSGAFAEGAESLSDWIHGDAQEIGLFLDNLQLIASDVFSFVGDVFSDIGTTLSDWWNGDGAEIFGNVCDAFLDIGTTLMNVWNDWIMPAWNSIVGIATSAWNDCLEPIFEKAVSFIGKVSDCIATIWNNVLSPYINWLIGFVAPSFTNVFNIIKGVFQTVFTVIGDIISALFDIFGGLVDFITGIFSGDIKKAFEGLCDAIWGVFEGLWAIIKGVLNLVIDALNAVWSSVYVVVAGIVNMIGGIAKGIGQLFGADDWGWEMPAEPPLIPKLAKGGIATAPTLALVGDNAGASSGNPEVIAPLNKLQSYMNSDYDTTLLTQILDYLRKLYELFVLFRNEGGGFMQFIATLDGDVVFENFVERVHLYQQRHHGALPWEGNL